MEKRIQEYLSFDEKTGELTYRYYPQYKAQVLRNKKVGWFRYEKEYVDEWQTYTYTQYHTDSILGWKNVHFPSQEEAELYLKNVEREGETNYIYTW